MTEIEEEFVVRRAELPGSRIDDEMVFFNQNSGTYYGTGLVGAVIWDFLDSPRSFGQICDHLLAKFEVEQETCERQVRDFLGDMLAEGILIADS